MSSRALRKLQREQEEQKQLAQLAATDEESGESESGDAATAKKPTQKNAFDFLNEADEDEQSEDSAEARRRDEEPQEAPADTESEHENASQPAPHRKSKKKGKKKKAGKGKQPAQSSTSPPGKESSLDEIDLALKALKVKNAAPTEEAAKDAAMQEDLKRFYDLLATDSKHLNALNEMKKLFGSTVLEGETADGAGQARRRGRGPQQLDLGGALAGRNNPVSRGQGLSGLVLRKNVFILGKEEWPKATSGGLGMELHEKLSDFTIEYRFLHSSIYQRVQTEFDACVESMDPQRMIHLLQYNPYHISTLLQVSEIAKQQGDHSVSADLLERALFTFGRSVHSTFNNTMSEGKVRLDFRRPENREFWLSAWRYIMSLGQRGTWRTAYEWSKLLLSLDPEGDPYRIRMIIDQLAIRGGQFEQLISLAGIEPTTVDWGQRSPNIQISLAMAHYKLKNMRECRDILSTSVKLFPWIFERLFRELNIERLPKSIWGKQPRTPFEQLQTESYAVRAKDIWNTPEALSFLVEVVETTEADSNASEPTDEEITRDDARHILLSEVPPLISHIPRSYTNERTSSSDPLPPEDNLISYGAAQEDDEDDAFEREFGPDRPDNRTDEQELRGLQSWFGSIINRLGLRGRTTNEDGEQREGGGELDEESVIRALEDSGVDISQIQQRGNRVNELRDRNVARHARLAEEMSRREDEMLAQALEQSARDQEDIFRYENHMDFLDSLTEEERSARGELEAEAQEQQDIWMEQRRNAVPQDASLAEASTPVSEAPATPPQPDTYDEQANQRWLAGRGMLALKEFITTYGADEKVWKDNMEVDSRPATEYAFRFIQLRQRSSRDFILNYSLPQGAGKEAGELIKRMIAS
ncbi:MAG: hypothetical protein MMC23_005397 [Stictis urceolatum]|nr:hypothetical protein [Stictis urceolata]